MTDKQYSDLMQDFVRLDALNKRLEKMLFDKPSLRDQFAMAAIQGLIAAYPDADCGPAGLASDAYMFADALLQEREK